MSLINYFRFVLSGYRRKIREVDGVKISYYYIHEADLFDPFKVLMDQYYKVKDLVNGAQIMLSEVSDYSKHTLDQLNEKRPHVLARFNVGIEVIEIRRYVLKIDRRTTSLYVIFTNKQRLAFLHKKYDYGREMEKTAKEISPSEHIPYNLDMLLKEGNPVLFYKGKIGYYVEKFVHTQVFYMEDSGAFMELCQKMERGSF